MKINTRKAIVGLLVMGAAQLSSFALVTDPLEAFNNSTIQPTGPRSGGNNLNFWNIEGSNYGNFASYGVADFSISALTVPDGQMLSSLNSLSFQLTQSNSGFTVNGGLRFYFTTDTSTAIGSGLGSPLFYDSSFAEEGIGSQLNTKYELGIGNFVQISTGTIDTFTFTLDGLDPAGLSYLTDLFTNGGTLRVIVAATDGATAATYAGVNNNNGVGPQMQLDYSTTAIPEPSVVALASLAGIILLWRVVRSRRTAVSA